MKKAKWILWYFKGILQLGLFFGINKSNFICVTNFVDFVWCSDLDWIRTLYDYLFTLYEYTIRSKLSLQSIADLSTIDTKYFADEGVKETI